MLLFWLALSFVFSIACLMVVRSPKRILKYEKSWKFQRVCEVVIVLFPIALPSFVAAFYVTRSFRNSLFFSILIIILSITKQLYGEVVQRSPILSRRYKMPLAETNGVLSEKRYTKSSFRRHWLTLETNQGQQIFYVPYLRPNIKQQMANLALGEHISIRYRKGKKFNYFEEFVHEGEREKIS